MSLEPLLSIEDLRIGFGAGETGVEVVRGVSFEVGRGEIVGLVGESGCGKSLTALATLGLLPAGGRVLGGRVRLAGAGDLLALGERELRAVRGRRLAMVFQEPASALNPVLTVGTQLVEALRRRTELPLRAARREAERLLERVAMPDPSRRLRSYPHQLSGGQRQRAMLAMALACGPDLLLADEPTTALDVSVQAQVLELLRHLREELGLAMLLITHDLAAVAETCDRVVVMYAGRVMEQAPVGELFARTAHPYTRALLAAVPRLGAGATLPTGIPGRVPEAAELGAGCAFEARCSRAMAECGLREPELFDVGREHRSRCWLHREPAVEAEPGAAA